MSHSIVFPHEPPHGLHTHSCGLQSLQGSQLPKVDTAGRKQAGAEYPYIGDYSSKFAFPYTFRSPIAPKPEFSRITYPCGLQGSFTPSTPHCSLAPESQRLPMPDKTYNPPLTHAQWVLIRFSKKPEFFRWNRHMGYIHTRVVYNPD